MTQQVHDLIFQADDCYDKKNFDEAIRIYTQLIAGEPHNPRFYALRGLCYSKKKDWEAAIREYSIALDLKPDAPSTLYNRGRAYQHTGQWNKALCDYRKSSHLLPEYDVFLNMGIIYEFLYEFESARQSYLKALRLKPEDIKIQNTLKLLMRKIKEIAGLRQITIKAPIRLGKKLNHAESLTAKGECELALSEYEFLIKNFPAQIKLYHFRGCCYFYMSDYESAVKDFSVFLSNAPKDANVLFNRGQAYAFLQNFNDAIMDFIASGEIQPKADIFCNLRSIFQYDKSHEYNQQYPEGR